MIPISFEFFPPRSADAGARLRQAADVLHQLGPRFFSVTYGADGSSRDATPETVALVRESTGIDTAPHISCIRTPEADLAALLDHYAATGVGRLVTIRGDLPEGTEPVSALRTGEDLVRFIRERHDDRFELLVGAYPECHPEAPHLGVDLEHFRTKVEAGADAAVTQYFYNADAYADFMDGCQRLNIDIPIVAGIMPIHDFTQVRRFSKRCGAEVPRWLCARMDGFSDDDSRRDFAADFVATLCQRLEEMGAPAFHFYTLNRAEPTLAVLERYAPKRIPPGISASN